MKKGTSIIKFVKDKQERTNARRAFHLWQIRPHEVAPLSNKQCKCACCGTEYVGNFCPRCGQSASVNHFSLKQAIDLFLDVWDVNNRSVFRTIRDMLLRPGYMIRDYLNGMQAGYFSPFKMFFMLATLSLLVENGVFFSPNESKSDADKDWEMMVKQAYHDAQEDTASEEEDTGTKLQQKFDSESGKLVKQRVQMVVRAISKFKTMNPALFRLILLVLFSQSLFVFFRHCPRFPSLSFSEFVAVLICSYNTYTLIMIINILFDSTIINFLAIWMLLLSLSQFSGYSKRRIFVYMTITIFLLIFLFIAAVSLGVYAWAWS